MPQRSNQTLLMWCFAILLAHGRKRQLIKTTFCPFKCSHTCKCLLRCRLHLFIERNLAAKVFSTCHTLHVPISAVHIVEGKSDPTKTWATGKILMKKILTKKKNWLITKKTQHGVNHAVSSQPLDTSSSSSVPHIVLTERPTSPSEISIKRTTTQVSSSAQRDRSTGGLSYSSYTVKSPRLLLLKQEPSTNQVQSQILDLNRAIIELEKGTLSDSSSSSPTPSSTTSKKPARLVKTELRIQESFEIDDKATGDGEEDESRVQECKEDIRLSTYRRMDNLEETIRELELSLLDFGTQTIPTWSQGTPDLDSRTSISSAPSSTAPIKSSGRGEIQRPPIPPKPSINTNAAKVQERTQPLASLALMHSLSLSVLVLLSAIDSRVIRRHDSEPPVSFCPSILFIFFPSHYLFDTTAIQLKFISSLLFAFCTNLHNCLMMKINRFSFSLSLLFSPLFCRRTLQGLTGLFSSAYYRFAVTSHPSHE